MPPIKRQCKLTGREFIISELEQKLREKFGVSLPDIHPYERMRHLMQFRNVYTLYTDVCDLCGKNTLSVWGEHPKFPIYCKECWFSDKWKPVEMDVDVDKPFFDQFQKLLDISPHLARIVADPMVNSDYCNHVSSIKNCYMCFNASNVEDCYYNYGSKGNKSCFDAIMSNDGELLYDSMNCHQSYQVFWSEFALNCTDCYFLYDCMGCSNCTLSTGLRHKEYVFENVQLTKEQYEEKVKELQSGSYEKIEAYKQRFVELKNNYLKKFRIGVHNEDVSGNFIFRSKNVIDSFDDDSCEDSVNMFNVRIGKDSLDIVAFGLEFEQCYSCATAGLKSMNMKYCWNSYENCTNLEYCALVISSSDCFGCVCARKKEYAILNKQYSKEEYEAKVKILKAKMTERGEYGQMYRKDMVPFAYNESIAGSAMPLSKQEVEARGYRWVEKKIPTVPQNKLYTPVDDIHDISWKDIEGKVLICEKSKRPFKVLKQEFDFYKAHHIPLPRLHPEVRIFTRYPSDMMFNLHEAQCNNCETTVQTSMPKEEKILCEKCYQNAVQ